MQVTKINDEKRCGDKNSGHDVENQNNISSIVLVNALVAHVSIQHQISNEQKVMCRVIPH